MLVTGSITLTVPLPPPAASVATKRYCVAATVRLSGEPDAVSSGSPALIVPPGPVCDAANVALSEPAALMLAGETVTPVGTLSGTGLASVPVIA